MAVTETASSRAAAAPATMGCRSGFGVNATQAARACESEIATAASTSTAPASETRQPSTVIVKCSRCWPSP